MFLLYPYLSLLLLVFGPPPAPEFQEKNGQVVMEAEYFTAMTGNWKKREELGRVVMRMNGPDGDMFAGRHMYLAYRIHFTTPGRYRLWGLMRSTGTKATDDVWVYWNREPQGESREDYELKVESTDYAWSATFKDLPPPEPTTKRPKTTIMPSRAFRCRLPASTPSTSPRVKSLSAPITPSAPMRISTPSISLSSTTLTGMKSRPGRG